jgi:diacylglycerol diphosphate phosphatase/phosphatidate phosphatase
VNDIKPQLHDPTISYLHTPLTEQKVPVSLLWKLSVMLPLVILAPLAAFPARGVSRGEQLCALWLGLCTSIATSYVCVNIVKVAVGRPRPDFLARCMPTPEGVCTGVASVVAEGRKSFPSGHSAFSFAGLGYASIVLAAALAQRRTPAAGNLWKVLVVSLPWQRRRHRGLQASVPGHGQFGPTLGICRNRRQGASLTAHVGAGGNRG